MPDRETVVFDGPNNSLSGVLHIPEGRVKGGVVLAHCFTCSKSYKIMRHVATEIEMGGYAVLRFDFTGLGESGGDFAETNITTNVGDLTAAAEFLLDQGLGPCLMVGHSLGGTAALLAAHDMPDIRAVAVIAAPATAAHVRRNFAKADVEAALSTGRVRVEIAGRPFDLSAEFFRELERHDSLDHIESLNRPLLVIHPTADRIVGIEEGEKIFATAKQPRWFIALPGANHLLTKKEHATTAARIIVEFLGTATQ